MRLKNKVSIVAGGASGIGRATSQLFAKEGAKVVVADIAIEEANKAVNSLKSLSEKPKDYPIDIPICQVLRGHPLFSTHSSRTSLA